MGQPSPKSPFSGSTKQELQPTDTPKEDIPALLVVEMAPQWSSPRAAGTGHVTGKWFPQAAAPVLLAQGMAQGNGSLKEQLQCYWHRAWHRKAQTLVWH